MHVRLLMGKMINGELIVDNFAGGGGASTGIEMATGISVDIAINHDPEAIRMHKANHPSTRHYCESVWDVDPVEVCNGRPVALAWFSPDCKHFSKAKGGKPKDKNIRGLAWVALRWAGLVRPRVIMLENVEEFKTWGPLNRRHRPIKAKQGETFRKFIGQLEELGYAVEYRELVAADYGAPTMRKRFFLVARCDGKPIIWPEPTHGPADNLQVVAGLLEPYVGAYTQIDFSLPCPSIFDTAEEIKEKYGIRAVRPLAPKTMERIARGLKKFVIDNAEPFIVQVNHSGAKSDYCNSMNEPLRVVTAKHGFGVVEPYIVPIGYGERKGQEPRVHDIEEPLPTVVGSGKHYLCEPYMVQIGQTGFTADKSKDVREPLTTIVSKNEHCLISPTLIQYHSETAAGEVRGQNLESPIMTVDGSNRYGLVTSFLHKYYDGGYTGAGDKLENSLPTVTAWDHNSVCAATLIQMNNHCDGRDIKEPIPTITAGDGHFGEVRAFLRRYLPDESDRSNKRTGGTRNNISKKRREVLEDCKEKPASSRVDSDRTKTYGSSAEIRISGSGCLEGRETISDVGTQSSMVTVCRQNTGRDGYQSHKRDQAGQPTGESGGCNKKSESASCNSNWSEDLQQLSREVFPGGKGTEEERNVLFENRETTGNISDGSIPGGEFLAHTLIKYYGQGTGQDIKEPLDTVTAQDRFGLVTIKGVEYQIVDIGLRMLEPKELYGCQGFPDDYIIDRDYTGKEYPRSEQVRRCGNAVCPPIPAALVRANLPELCVAERMPNMRTEQEQTGQIRFA